MTPSELANRFSNYADAVVAFSILNALAFMQALGEEDIRAGINEAPSSTLLIGLVLSYALPTSMLVDMSRFRVGIEPLLLVCAAVVLAGVTRERRKLAAASTLATWAGLLFLWWVNWPEVWTIFSEMVWRAHA